MHIGLSIIGQVMHWLGLIVVRRNTEIASRITLIERCQMRSRFMFRKFENKVFVK